VELKHFLQLLWRWSWLVVLLMGMAGTAAYALSKNTIPIYEASTTLMIDQMAANGVTVDLNALRTSEELAGTYVALLRKRPVMEAVIANVKLDTNPDRLAKNVSVSLIADTQLIVVTVEDPDPQRAADIANEVVRVFSQQNRELQASRYAATKQNLQQELSRIQAEVDNTQAKLDGLETVTTPEQKAQQEQLRLLMDQQRSSYTTVLRSYEQVRVTAAQTIDNLNVVEPARPEPVPVRPKTSLNMLLAALVAAMIGVGLVYIFGYLDDSVKSSEELERLIDVPTLASIPRIAGGEFRDKLIVHTDSKSPIAETYRMLRTNIDFATIDRPIRTIVVTSSRPSEGKSVTVANLGIALAQTGKRVILVDADLRRPTLHKYFEQSNMRGVTTALLRHSEDPVSDHLLPSGVHNLRLMPSGPMPPNPAELLGSQRMATLIEELSRQADVVLFDSPPLLAVVDGALLSHVCDATLLVALAGVTRADALRSSKDHLLQSGARLLGTVLNQVSASHGGYYYQAYYSSDAPRKPRIKWWRGKSRRSRDASRAALAESVARRAVVEGTLNQQLHRWRNGGTHPAADTIALRTLVETTDQPLYRERNGSNHAVAENGALHAPVEETDQRQTESADDQRTPSAGELTILTSSVGSSSVDISKRIVQSSRQAKRTARKLPKTTH
jgi:capsular exopolysaccharide synthesis family protein